MQPNRTLTDGSISRSLLFFTLPILIGNVLHSLNGSVNAIWVGRFLGEAALTATSIANTVMFLLLGCVFGVSMAATILVGQSIGASDFKEARRVVGTSASFFALLSVGLSIAGWLLCRPLLLSMGTPADSLPFAMAYMRVIFLALPFMYMLAFVVSVLRGAGDSKTPFQFMLMSVVIDIALNPLFIFGWGPVPAFGIAGSGLATLVAQAVSLFALVNHLYRRRHMLCLHADELALLRMDPIIVGTLVRKGFPMGLQMLVLSLSGVLMITLVNRFGVDTTAAFGAALQVWSYIQMPAFAVGMAVSAMAAQNVGAGKWDRVATTAKIGCLYSFLLTGSIVVIIEIFARQALGLFLPAGSAALDIAVHLNRIVAWSFVFFGVTMVLFGVVRATGAVLAPLLILVFTLLLIRYPAAELLLDAWQADAIWWSFPISSLIAVVMAVAYYKYGNWRVARMPGARSTDVEATIPAD